MKTIFKIALLLIYMYVVVPAATIAQAGTPAVLRITPVFNDLRLNPGQTIKHQVTITNLSNSPLPIKAYSRGFVATDEVGGSDYPDDQAKNAVQSWFTIDKTEFILQPRSKHTAHVSITAPKDATYGGHYATLFFESLVPKTQADESALFVSARVGTLYFLGVEGNIRAAAEIADFSTAQLHQRGPINFNLSLHNIGNIHFMPEPVITIKNFGREVVKISVPASFVLPDATRSWSAAWDKPWPLGFYTAKISINVPLTSDKIEHNIWFIGFPLKQALLTVMALGLPLILYKGRYRIRKAIKAFEKNQ